MKHQPIFALGMALALTACSGNSVRDTLGLNRAAPDEFRVVSRPPLSVPPQFTLQPPSATQQPMGTVSASEQAKSLVTGGKNNATASKNTLKPGTADTAVMPVTVSSIGGTQAESSFLAKAGASAADPAVRDKLTEEHYAVQEKEQDGGSWWNPFSSGDSSKKEPLVNATKEAERIKTDTDAGKSVTEGETPQVKAKDTGVLGRIFGY